MKSSIYNNDTESNGFQVCNLGWSKNVNEIVSTHGYSQNQIMVWKYPSMAKVLIYETLENSGLEFSITLEN